MSVVSFGCGYRVRHGKGSGARKGKCNGSGTPITKIVFIATTLATLVVLSNKSQHAVSLDASRVFGPEREWWRLMTSMLPMATAWELLVALQLMWSFRVFERLMGPAKFGSFLFLTAFLGKSLELALCVQFPRLRPPSGPLATLAALSTMYYGYIPSTAKPYLATGDLRMTEKVMTYMSSLVLALQRSWSSFMPCACGVLVALLYCSSVLPLQSFRVPGRPLFAVLGTLFRSSDQLALRRMRMASLQQRNRMGAAQRPPEERLLPPESVAGIGPRLRHRAELPPPSEEDIELLMGLGFDRNTVIQVLRSSGNNKEAAANTLLGH